MKYVPAVLIAVSLILSFVLWGGFRGGLAGVGLFVLWVAAPLLFALAVAVLKLRGRPFTLVVPITGALVGLLGLCFYYEAYAYDGPDGQAGLIFAVMPVYQFLILGIVGCLSYLIRRFG